MPRINTGDIQEFEAIPAGIYDAVCSQAEYIDEDESDSGNAYVKFEFTIDDGDFAGRKVFRNGSTLPQSLWALKRILVALGTDPEVLAGEWDTDEVLPAVQGNPCRVNVGIRDFEGEEVNEVKRVLAAAGARV